MSGAVGRAVVRGSSQGYHSGAPFRDTSQGSGKRYLQGQWTWAPFRGNGRGYLGQWAPVRGSGKGYLGQWGWAAVRAPATGVH